MPNFDDLLNNTPSQEQGAPQFSKEEYATKKKAEREELYELSDQTAYGVVADYSVFQSFLDLQARLDRYSAVNALLVFAKNPEASRLGSFEYWQSHNCSPKLGQKAIGILEPGKEYERKDGNGTGISYNAKKVFDISQVNTHKLKNTHTPSYTERQLLAALISKAPLKIRGVEDLPGGLGAITDTASNEIRVRKGMEFPDSFRSIAKELAYANLTTGPDTQADPHFSSYCASYLLCKKYGVDTKAFSFDDTPGFFDGMDAQDIKGELSQIRGVAEDISGRMARQLEAMQKAPKDQGDR